jgi:hypothetical protein
MKTHDIKSDAQSLSATVSREPANLQEAVSNLADLVAVLAQKVCAIQARMNNANPLEERLE